MAILSQHLQFYREIFDIPGLLSDPFLMIGYQDIGGHRLPPEYQFPDVKAFLADRGLKDVRAMDFFDERADIKHDLNFPVDEKYHEQFRTVLDIGSAEHVFQAPRCLESCMRMVAVDGYYVLVTIVNGYLGHGFHVFNPQGLVEMLKCNGFTVEYLKYSTPAGRPLRDPSDSADTLIWLVGKKTTSLGEFRNPQQPRWENYFGNEIKPHKEATAQPSAARTAVNLIKDGVIGGMLRWIWSGVWLLRKHLKRWLKFYDF